MPPKKKPGADPRPTRARKAGRKIDDVPGTVTHRKVAEKLGITPETLRRWVAKGAFPRPLAVIETIWLYREDIIRAFLQTGKWPEGTEFRRPATRQSPEDAG
jgi:predicted DNA-binding transcriptional regulator AlpA